MRARHIISRDFQRGHGNHTRALAEHEGATELVRVRLLRLLGDAYPAFEDCLAALSDHIALLLPRHLGLGIVLNGAVQVEALLGKGQRYSVHGAVGAGVGNVDVRIHAAQARPHLQHRDGVAEGEKNGEEGDGEKGDGGEMNWNERRFKKKGERKKFGFREEKL